jgi:uncharacterized membrane protein YfcA
MDYLSPEVAVLLTAVGLVAGFVDAIAGGGGLLAIPALLAAGLPVQAALATNKLQGTFGSFSASLKFIRRGYVSFDEIRVPIAFTFAGGALGAILVQTLDPGFLRSLIPVLLIASALYFMFSPHISDVERHQRMSHATFGALVGTSIGFYDGFFGPGTGSFFVVACVSLLGFTMTKATAHTKVLNFTSNIASLIFFIVGGNVVWEVGLLMALGQVIGARLGAEVVIGRGAAIVRPMLVTVCLIMTVKLALDAYAPGWGRAVLAFAH